MSLVPYDDSSSDSKCDSIEDIADNFNCDKSTNDYIKSSNATSEKCDGTSVVSDKADIVVNRNANRNGLRNTTKIHIPKLRSFRDVNDLPRPSKVIESNAGLLQLLPKAKTEVTDSSTGLASNSNTAMPIAFIPNAVKYKRPTCNTENVDQTYNNFARKKIKQSSNSDPSNIHIAKENISENDNNSYNTAPINFDSCDHTDSSKKSASKFDNNANNNGEEEENVSESPDFFGLKNDNELSHIDPDDVNIPTPPLPTPTNSHEIPKGPEKLDKNAMQALHGSAAKRQSARYENITFVDISSTQVHPDRDEWLRNAMRSSTKYEPTGVLKDEEPAAGTRRKHQITYLAHKAKANEAELQAIWSANRQTRRVTQNKYGF